MMALALRSVRRSLDEQAVKVDRSLPVEPLRAPHVAPPTKTQARLPRAQQVESSRGGRPSFDLSVGRSETVVEERCSNAKSGFPDAGAQSETVWSEYATTAPLCIGMNALERAAAASAEEEAPMPPRPSFVFVHPSKALDFTGESAKRVTPRASMERLLAGIETEYETKVFGKAAIALRKDCERPVCCSASDTSMTIVFGKIENTDYFKRKHNLDGSCSQSEVINQLAGTAKNGLMPALRGEFMLVHYDANEDEVFAATDVARTYGFQQGRDCTGGLLITDVAICSDNELSEVPAASFIFGKSRGRNIHKYASTLPEFEQARTDATAAALRALSGLTSASRNSSVSGPAAQSGAPVRGNMLTTSTRAEKSSSWRRSSRAGQSHSTVFSSSRVVTNSHRPVSVGSGSADNSSSWRKL